MRYEFPAFHPGFRLPREVAVLDGNVLLEVGSDGVHEKLHLPANSSVKKFKVFPSYQVDRVLIHYLIIDAKNNLYVVERDPKLKVVSTLNNVSEVQIRDSAGRAECRIKFGNKSWENLLFEPNGVKAVALSNDTGAVEAVSPALQGTLKKCETRLQLLEQALRQKKLLRAATILERDFTKHLKVSQVGCFYLHGRLVYTAKVVNQYDFPVEDLRLAAFSERNAALLQPLPLCTLRTKESALLMGICTSPFPPSSLSVQYKANDSQFHLPLVCPDTQNLHQQLKILGVEDCLKVLNFGSGHKLQVQWNNLSVDRLRTTLSLTNLLEDVTCSISSSASADLPGTIFVERRSKNSALVCYRGVSELEMLKRLLSRLPVSIGKIDDKGSEKRTIANDVALIKSKKQMCRKSIPLETYMKILQDLVHKMSAFQK
ncbi:uncharacterized protein LOC135942418 [Cloeon dipterum]|uniref:uncharacterized protein LOC135942418 n=1 Tax=Cloeon dipterum TaxID=197152 RepID=UPI0032209231